MINPTLRKVVGLATFAALTLFCAQAKAGGKFRPLFNGKDLTGWKVFLGGKGDPEKSIVVRDGEIQVTGVRPNGYFYTEKPYKNYVLRYTWRYPKEQPKKTSMNSGCLIHIQKPHKVWPQSVEPQCRYSDHGKLYFIGLNRKKHKTEQDFNKKAQKKALKPSHEWNTTEVTAKADGSVEVRINGTLVNTGSSTLTSGPIGFQCEGARIHFKDIEIKDLK